MKSSVAFAFLICLVFSRPAIAQSPEEDELDANPGRPTVSTPATLTPVGYLQFESGFTGAHNSPEFSSRYSFNEVLKLSVTRRLEFLASAEPVAHFTADDATANRVADVFLGAQGVLFQGDGPKLRWPPAISIVFLMAAHRSSILAALPIRYFFSSRQRGRERISL